MAALQQRVQQHISTRVEQLDSASRDGTALQGDDRGVATAIDGHANGKSTLKDTDKEW